MSREGVSDEFVPPVGSELDREAELVRRAKGYESGAWTEIYDSLQARLFRYVEARVGDRDTAEDLTATIFLEALKSIGSYRSRGRPLLAWLYTIARNVVNYHHRSAFRKRATLENAEKRHSSSPPGEMEALEELGSSSDPDLEVEIWDLREAINQLSNDQREVIILRYFVGLTTPEVATLVGKNERAVYSLQARAIQALRLRLK